tara:strand:+ start:790 stop:1272 length:483 start_codon:yes stop_codon:yes gene_type:complete
MDKNGRIIFENEHHKNYKLVDKDGFEFIGNQSLSGIQEDSYLSKVFFSKQNLNLLQQLIRYGVFEKSNQKYKIGNQSESEIVTIMRSMYLQFAKNLDTDIKGQVRELNKYVIDFAVEKIMSAATQHINYLNEIQTTINPMDRGQNTSSVGTKLKERKEFM